MNFKLKFHSISLELDPHGCVWIPSTKQLLVADLHLEKSSFFAKTGQFLPPYESLTTLTKLKKLVDDYEPHEIVSLGDHGHDSEAFHRMPPQAREIWNKLQEREWKWIVGNHDVPHSQKKNALSERMDSQTHLMLSHDPFYKSVKTSLQTPTICGHYHPKVKISSQNRHWSVPCFVEYSHLLILPAFGSYTGGTSWPHALFPLQQKFKIYGSGKDRVYQIQ